MGGVDDFDLGFGGFGGFDGYENGAEGRKKMDGVVRMQAARANRARFQTNLNSGRWRANNQT